MDTQEKILSEMKEINSSLRDINSQLSYSIESKIKRGVESAMQNIVLWIIAIVAMGLMGDWVKSKFF